MRDEFLEHYVPSQEEFIDMWTSGLFIFDTNALLRLFRYRELTVNQIFEILEAAGERVWSPYQIAWEYQRNRLVKIREAETSFQLAMKDFETAHNASSTRLRGLQDFGIHPKLQLDGKVSELSKYVETKINEIRSEYNQSPLAEYFAEVHNKLGTFYNNKLGAKPSEQQLNDRIATAKSRTTNNIPPGFVDSKSKGKDPSIPERSIFGDVLIWFEILEHAKVQKKHIIFITEDNKEDWWQIEGGRTLGALPELRREFRTETGKNIYFYNVKRFLENARIYLKANVSAESLADAEKNSDASGIFVRASLIKGNEQEDEASINDIVEYLKSLSMRAFPVDKSSARMKALQAEHNSVDQEKQLIREALIQFPIEERRLPHAAMSPELKEIHGRYINIVRKLKELKREIRDRERILFLQDRKKL